MDDNGTDFINEILGTTDSLLWITGLIFMIYEPIKVKTAQGFSINMLLMNLVAYSLLLTKDIYGYFGDAKLDFKVYWFNLLKSGITTLVYIAGFLLVRYYRSRGNRYTKFGIWPPAISLIFITLYLHLDKNLDNIMMLCGSVTYVLNLLSYVPQIVLITRNKSTKGWSIIGITFLVVSSGISILRGFLDYVFLKKKDKKFFEEFNFDNFSFDLFSILLCCVFYYQHILFNRKEIHRNRYLVEIDKMKEVFMDVNDFSKKALLSQSFA